MLKDRHWLRGLCVVLAAMFISTAWADVASSPDEDELITELEKQLSAQRTRLARLNEQVTASSAFNQDAARAEAMKQQIREVLSEQEFRESLMPTMLQAGYDEGFFIKSSDEKFLLSIYGRLQFRWTHYATHSANRYLRPRLQRNDRTGFDMERYRIGFCGHAYTKDLTYCFELEADSADGYTFVPGDAWVNYRFSDPFQVQVGFFKLASTRAQMTNDANLQFVDRPMVDAVFGLGYGIGVRFWGSFADGALDYYIDAANSITNGEGVGIGRTITNDPAQLDNNPALLFRAVWHALGQDEDFSAQADHKKNAGPALDLGFHYACN